ncbi:vWA domain-containing protein [Actibacterium lipolyticum]|uniref:VWA domain containing CoxE-like protein n=1 Tax=Actibacterium lipolyticum TaxID=1524263 RepID=A0A238JN29_9RHOB|nr:VWA domain-containing protein [Actibacterium lipolyticum]SMX32080.1 VWA domain containing CoxE-like protein [Actibacterium lipolyticum]
MSRVTRFAARDPGIAARMAGFIVHLRENGLKLGVGETEVALNALAHVAAADPKETRLALKAVCTSSADDAARFDELFQSYWMNGGRVKARIAPTNDATKREDTRSSLMDEGQSTGKTGKVHSPDGADGEGDTAGDGTGKLVASSLQNLMKKDLRDLVDPQDIAAAEVVARKLAAAIRDRRSRRRKAARKGDQIDFRRVMRRSMASGGEPLHLPRKRRPERPVQITALCDVSGSMSVYARVFLAFLSGLMRADDTTDAYLFHTRLVRVTDALRDDDPLRSLNRLTLLSDGFGGGSKIGENLDQFARTYARRFVTGRSVVIIFSDGYDTATPDAVGDALKRLKRRGCRVIWLNPLKGWAGYEPTSKAMAAALPHLDLFAAANTLETLAALEPELAKI